MTGETRLEEILKTLRPEWHKGEYVFCSVAEVPDEANEAIMWFRESEGITLIVRKEIADRKNWPYSFVAGWITLSVHSSLEAVGLTAKFSSALAAEGISCNVVAGFYHDHLFVPYSDATRALHVLENLSK